MARTAITVQELRSHDSATLSYTAGDATNDHSFTNTGKELLIVKNGLTDALVTVLGVTDANKRTGNTAQTVTASTEAIFGPFPVSLYNQADGKVQVDLDDDTNVELTVVRMAP